MNLVNGYGIVYVLFGYCSLNNLLNGQIDNMLWWLIHAMVNVYGVVYVFYYGYLNNSLNVKISKLF